MLAIALGYRDLNDHEALRHDELLALLSDKPDPSGANRVRERDKGKAPTGKSTLNRLELTPEGANAKSRYKKIVARSPAMDELLVDLFVESFARPPKQIVVNRDATDDRLHCNQQGRSSHG